MVLTLSGRLLVATPLLEDPNFRRAVVLVLDHDDDGALGVVLNQPSEVSVDEVLDGWAPVVTGDPVLWVGGPVGPDSALGVARLPEAYEPEGVRAVPAAGLGLVDLDADPALLAPQLGAVRIFAGYSGWGSGQLEEELSDGGWYVVDAAATRCLHDPARHPVARGPPPAGRRPRPGLHLPRRPLRQLTSLEAARRS